MAKLEKYIRDHQGEFDSAEPAPGHFERFETRLQQQRDHISPGMGRFAMLQAAALILILIALGVFVFELATKGIMDRLNNRSSGTELPQDVKDAVQYYDFQVARQLDQIHTLASDANEAQLLSMNAEKEMKNLENSAHELKKCLSENPNNERVLAALIQNQQMKEGIMNNIIQQLNQVRNQ